jgi:hypothetical protein
MLLLLRKELTSCLHLAPALLIFYQLLTFSTLTAGARSTAEAVAIALRVVEGSISSSSASTCILDAVKAASDSHRRFLPLQGDHAATRSGPVRLGPNWKRLSNML